MSAGKLIRMADEIATFFRPYSDAEAIAGIHNHIASFWTPKMIADLRAAVESGAADVDPLVMAALRRSAPPTAAPTEKEAAGPSEIGEIGASDAG